MRYYNGKVKRSKRKKRVQKDDATEDGQTAQTSRKGNAQRHEFENERNKG